MNREQFVEKVLEFEAQFTRQKGLIPTIISEEIERLRVPTSKSDVETLVLPVFNKIDFFLMTNEEFDKFLCNVYETAEGWSLVQRHCSKVNWDVRKVFLRKDLSSCGYTRIIVGADTSRTKYRINRTKGGWMTCYSKEGKTKHMVTYVPLKWQGVISNDIWRLLPYRLKLKVAKTDRVTEAAYLITGFKSPRAIESLYHSIFGTMTLESFREIVKLHVTGPGIPKKVWHLVGDLKSSENKLHKKLWKLIQGEENTQQVLNSIINANTLVQWRGYNNEPGFVFEEIDSKRVNKNWKETNEYLIALHNKDAEDLFKFKTLKQDAQVAFMYQKYLTEFQAGPYRIITPSSPLQVREWAQANHHCLAGYAHRHGIGGLIFQVEVGEEKYEVFAHAERTDDVYVGLGHFQGMRNKSAPQDIRSLVISSIQKSDVWKEFTSDN